MHDTDVRTILGVGEELQGERSRRSGDACDSLVLWDREAVEGLDHRRRVPGRDGWGMPSHNAEHNWDLALDAWD